MNVLAILVAAGVSAGCMDQVDLRDFGSLSIRLSKRSIARRKAAWTKEVGKSSENKWWSG
ncbi:hypothetical protein NBRC116593_11700 [Sulfitobacter pacificus]